MYIILVTKGINEIEIFACKTVDEATDKVNELGAKQIYSKWRIAYLDEENPSLDQNIAEGKF